MKSGRSAGVLARPMVVTTATLAVHDQSRQRPERPSQASRRRTHLSIKLRRETLMGKMRNAGYGASLRETFTVSRNSSLR